MSTRPDRNTRQQRRPNAPQRAGTHGRPLTRSVLALRFGATLFGVLAGIACYIGLDQLTAIGMVPAFIIGLVFALLTRTAAAALAQDWLLRSARRTANNRGKDQQ